MKKYLFVFLVLLSVTLMSCSQNKMPGEKPPKVNILTEYGNDEAVLGTYCWNGTCVDTAGTLELLSGTEPIRVHPGEKISLEMNEEPKPNKFHLIQVSEGQEKEVLLEKNSFIAPTEKGTYYYSYGVWWLDEKEENISHGDAF